MCTVIGLIAVSCSRHEGADVAQIEEVNSQKAEPPTEVFLQGECHTLPKEVGSATIAPEYAEVSFELKDISEEPKIEWAILDGFGKRLAATRVCSQGSATLLLRTASQHASAVIYVREETSGRLFTLESVRLTRGKRVHFGSLSGTVGHVAHGSLDTADAPGATGKIAELGWGFKVRDDGTWSTGALPFGQWSVEIASETGAMARWNAVLIDSGSQDLGPARLLDSNFSIVPLWDGSLKSSTGHFFVSAPPEYAEMRISDDMAFRNSFWLPFSNTLRFPFSARGNHVIYVQFRTPSGELSQIFAETVSVELLDLSAQADAQLENSILSVFNPNTTVVTSPPEGAIQHSVTLNVDELPRTWVSVEAPLEISLPKSLESCGSHTVYVRFRDAEQSESQSLTRTLHVRCWDQNIPSSPLAARYGHASIALKLNGTSSDPDAVFIWGGRDETQTFNDGAIFTKTPEGEWAWEMLPASPLSGRYNVQVTVGKKHVLVFGGLNQSGEPAGDWAFYDTENKQWFASSLFSGDMPPTLLHASIGFIEDLNPAYDRGLFIVVGGETVNPQTISDKYYAVFESGGGLSPSWLKLDAPQGVSRATSSIGNHPGFFFVHSGITAPTGTTNSDSSGSDPDISAHLQVFSFATSPANGSVSVYPRIYKANNSRTGALNGHAFLTHRPVSAGETLTIDSLIEKQTMCVFGAEKYSDVLPQICSGLTPDGKPKIHQPFCRRIYDSYLFAPVGRLGMCFEPVAPPAGSTEGTLNNFYLAIDRSPKERRISNRSTFGINSASFLGGLFYWSGLSPTGGEYLADGAIYFTSNDSWLPISNFEAPAPRMDHSATFMRQHSYILIWGGRTAAGITSQGALYAIPEGE